MGASRLLTIVDTLRARCASGAAGRTFHIEDAAVQRGKCDTLAGTEMVSSWT